MKLVFDAETNGFLADLDTVHSLVLKDIDNGQVHSFKPAEIEAGIELLTKADEIIGHNVIRFDLPALKKVYPEFKPKARITDTLVISRLLYPDLKERDFRFARKNEDFPKKLIGSHSLEAWGHRLTNHKQQYEGGFDKWSEEMQRYCEQDVEVTAALFHKLTGKGLPPDATELEHDVQRIIWRQEEHGFPFDERLAGELYATLAARRAELANDLRVVFPPWEVSTPFTPKRNNARLGYVEGVTVYKTKEVEFNPSSRDHIAQKLIERHNWKPTEFTPEGKPKVDDEVLSTLEYPEAKVLAEYFMIEKRIGQLAEGREAWLKSVKDGRIHGRVNTIGAVTGRMTHHHPNMAQVPSIRKPYGKECRALFTARPGYSLVGADADALELRCLAGYMAVYDGGEYIKTVLEGDKSKGTDMHSLNARVLGCDRDTAKTWFYAFIYGAGDFKLGTILGKGAGAGRNSRRAFLSSLPALKRLIEGVRKKARERGFLVGLDGRRLSVRSEHAAFNTLLQSAGATFMKRALVILDNDLQEAGRVPGVDYEFVANIHDEWQIEVKHGYEKEVAGLATRAIRRAGEHYGFRCPLDGNSVIGRTWADTH